MTATSEATGTQVAEYTKTEAALADLRKQFGDVVFDVTTKEGMKAAKEARKKIRGYRTALEDKRKEIKAPALERCRLIDSEAHRITAALRELEDPIAETIKEEENRAERERLAAIEAERERVEGLQAKIQGYRDAPMATMGKGSDEIAGILDQLREDPPSEDEFAEYFEQAQDAHTAAVAKIQQAHADQLQHEEEQRKIAAERAELQRQREENERLQREAEERRQADAARERQRVERITARIRVIEANGTMLDGMSVDKLRERLDKLQSMRSAEDRASFEEFADDAMAAYARAEESLVVAIDQAEQRAAEQERLEAQRREQAAEAERLAEERRQLEAEQAEAARKAEADRLASLSVVEAAQAVVDYFKKQDVPPPRCILDLEAVLNKPKG